MKVGNEMTTNTATCPTCESTLNGAVALDGDDIQPKPGDISLCAYCFDFLVFTDDLQLAHKDISDLDLDLQEQLMQARNYGLSLRKVH